jgi:hypothetical protein
MPPRKQIWGDEFAMCVDKFGVAVDGQYQPAADLAE